MITISIKEMIGDIWSLLNNGLPPAELDKRLLLMLEQMQNQYHLSVNDRLNAWRHGGGEQAVYRLAIRLLSDPRTALVCMGCSKILKVSYGDQVYGTAYKRIDETTFAAGVCRSCADALSADTESDRVS